MADREEFATEVGELIKDRSLVGHTHAWDDVTSKPATFPPAAHQHPVADVTGLADRLAVLERSTGWRSIPLGSGTGGQLFLKREGSRVSAVVSAFRPASTGTNLLAELPAGFRPRFTGPPIWADEAGAPRPVYTLSYSPFRLEVRAIAAAGSYVYASGGWDTSDPWPTTLPGTPA